MPCIVYTAHLNLYKSFFAELFGILAVDFCLIRISKALIPEVLRKLLAAPDSTKSPPPSPTTSRYHYHHHYYFCYNLLTFVSFAHMFCVCHLILTFRFFSLCRCVFVCRCYLSFLTEAWLRPIYQNEILFHSDCAYKIESQLLNSHGNFYDGSMSLACYEFWQTNRLHQQQQCKEASFIVPLLECAW